MHGHVFRHGRQHQRAYRTDTGLRMDVVIGLCIGIPMDMLHIRSCRHVSQTCVLNLVLAVMSIGMRMGMGAVMWIDMAGSVAGSVTAVLANCQREQIGCSRR